MDEVTRTTRIDIVAAEINLRETVSLFCCLIIPEFTAMYIKEDFVAQIGAADTKRYDCIDTALDGIRKFLQMRHGFR